MPDAQLTVLGNIVANVSYTGVSDFSIPIFWLAVLTEDVRSSGVLILW